jgi:hypothetical protein
MAAEGHDPHIAAPSGDHHGPAGSAA